MVTPYVKIQIRNCASLTLAKQDIKILEKFNPSVQKYQKSRTVPKKTKGRTPRILKPLFQKISKTNGRVTLLQFKPLWETVIFLL